MQSESNKTAERKALSILWHKWFSLFNAANIERETARKRREGLDRKLSKVASPDAAAMRKLFAAMPTDILIESAQMIYEEISSRRDQGRDHQAVNTSSNKKSDSGK